MSGNSSEGNDPVNRVDEGINMNATTEVSDVKSQALAYAGIGWKIFPVFGFNPDGTCACGEDPSIVEGSRCTPGKHPAISSWNSSATSDATIVEQWWNENPLYNIGVVCNQSGLVAIDVDPRNGGLDSLEFLEANLGIGFPTTPKSITGAYDVGGKSVRGMHIFLAATQDDRFRGNLTSKTKKDNLPGIDIKHNGYVVLPGSLHASGVTYEWAQDADPFTTPPAEVPKELLEVIQSTKSKSGSDYTPMAEEQIRAIQSKATTTTDYGAKALADELASLSQTPKGSRNTQLFSSGISIGQLIAGNQIAWDEGLQGLLEAAEKSGLDRAEALQVLVRVDGAIPRGLSEPRGPVVVPKGLLDWAALLTTDADSTAVSTPTIRELANILDWEELFAGPPVEEDWLVPGLICSERGHSVYSAAGLGKSLIMREIAACLASGRSVLGHESREPMPVLYLDYENSPYGDITRSLRDMGFTQADLGNFHLASFPEFEPMDTKTGGKQVMELVDVIKPRLVVIDTVSRVVEGDENSNDTWLRFFSHVGQKLKKAKIAYGRLDHEGLNPAKGARGGSAKNGDVDFIWRYKGVVKNSKFTFECQKERTPVPKQQVKIVRKISPNLHHVVDTENAIDWKHLVEQHRKFLVARELIVENFDTEKAIPSQRMAWKKLQATGVEEKITRDILNSAVRSFSIIPAGDEYFEATEQMN
jgi:hypothetical protein